MAKIDDESSISIESAISYAERMRNSFRAFEKLGDVLKLTQQAEQRARDGDMTAKKLEAANVELLQKREALQQAVNELDVKHHDEVKRSQQAHGVRLASYAEEVRKAEHDRTGMLAKIQADLDTAQQEKKASITALEVEENRLRDVTANLRAELHQLRSRIPES